MATKKSSDYFEVSSNDSDDDRSYDSEAGEQVKGKSSIGLPGRRPTKRRRVDSDAGSEDEERTAKYDKFDLGQNEGAAEGAQSEESRTFIASKPPQRPRPSQDSTLPNKSTSNPTKQDPKAGVVYLSRLPPYLKPSTLRTLLSQRGFSPITKVFLTPASKNATRESHAQQPQKSNRRPTYTDGWIEFRHQRTARLCAETLNATIVGGKKGGWYHDDVWNVKYLKGFGWDDLMEGVRRERKEAEAKEDLERRRAGRDARIFVEGVERGKMVEGMNKRRKVKVGDDGKNEGDGESEVRRTFRQSGIVGPAKGRGVDTKKRKGEELDVDVQRVLSKIF